MAQAPGHQSSQFLPAFTNYRRSVPSHGARPATPLAATWESRCLFPRGPLDSVPGTLGTVSCRMYSLLDRVLLNPARTRRVFSTRHPPPSSTSLPEATSLCRGFFNANITGSKYPSDQLVPMYHCTSDPAPQEILFDHALRALGKPFVIHLHAQPRSFSASMPISMSMSIPLRRSRQEPESRETSQTIGTGFTRA